MEAAARVALYLSLSLSLSLYLSLLEYCLYLASSRKRSVRVIGGGAN